MLRKVRHTVLRLSPKERTGKVLVCPREDVKHNVEAGEPSVLLQTLGWLTYSVMSVMS